MAEDGYGRVAELLHAVADAAQRGAKVQAAGLAPRGGIVGVEAGRGASVVVAIVGDGGTGGDVHLAAIAFVRVAVAVVVEGGLEASTVGEVVQVVEARGEDIGVVLVVPFIREGAGRIHT